MQILLKMLFGRLSDIFLNIYLVISIPLAIWVSVLADKIIVILYGREYEQAFVALRILIWSEVLIFLYISLANVSNCIGKQVVVTKQTAVSALFNLITNFFFIPRYAFVGASFTAVASEIIGSLFFYFNLVREDIDYRLISVRSIIDLAKIIISGFLCYFSLDFLL